MKKRNFYSSLSEASEAARQLGLKSAEQYKKGYKQDARLPRYPSRYYKDWEDWSEFLGFIKHVKYETLEEASAAARLLGFKTSTQYLKGYKQDDRLLSDPRSYKYWKGWRIFLGTSKPVKYDTLEEASRAARQFGFKNREQYLNGYKQDAQLPSDPAGFYKGWEGWEGFLGQPVRYETLEEAGRAARQLGFENKTQYVKGYKKDARLRRNPFRCYKNWKDWETFLGISKPVKYETLKEASKAARQLGFKTSTQYLKGYRQDARLLAAPGCYKDWKGWKTFLGTVRYDTLEEASSAARRLGFKSSMQYLKGYKQDDGLTRHPSRCYKDWEGWGVFLGIIKPIKYETLGEASMAARQLGFKTSAQYLKGYKQDALLPPSPLRCYKDWKGWKTFLGTVRYETLEEASAAARLLDFKNRKQYISGYKQDGGLPRHPSNFYKDWEGWDVFLGIIKPVKYETLEEASRVACQLGFKNRTQYRNGYKQDERLPCDPSRCYEGWEGWEEFLGPLARYETLEEAGSAARQLGFENRIQYVKGYKKDPRLFANPSRCYEDWSGWKPFLLPLKYNCLKDIKVAIKILGIKNSKVYRDVYKKYPPLPAHPDRVFKNEWVSWFDTCDIPTFYCYEEAVEKLSILNLRGVLDYSEYIKKFGGGRFPTSPEESYKGKWRNFYIYLGNEEPFVLKYIYAPYLAWKIAIEGFLKIALGGSSKEPQLCRFVRLYIQRNEQGITPELFLTKKNHDIKSFKELLINEKIISNPRRFSTAVIDFLDYVLLKSPRVENKESGELVFAKGAKNPFKSLYPVASNQKIKLDETCKPALAYQYMEAVREWITPPSAENFKDLKSLQTFTADWIEVDPKIIDESDPDCVFKKDGDKTKIWFPTYWVHTLSLVSIPARGGQIAYNDSGEADKEVPVITEGKKITWVKNESPIAGLTVNEGFIKRYPDEQLGMHFTSNKTSSHGAAHNVPWIPENLAYWLIKLRDWQQNYNPIQKPMLWLDCTRTGLNETQRKSKGSNCFLFRDFLKEEPGIFSGRLATRLAAALYSSQPEGIKLAEIQGAKEFLGSYKTLYTPHTMRVSFITAYVMEFGLPIEMITKLVGHSSLVMSIYYVKINSETLRERFELGEKKALKEKAYAAQKMIEAGRIDEIKGSLVGGSEGALNAISGGVAAGNYQFFDYGFCAFGGARCADGGLNVFNTEGFGPVPSGHLGMRNCIRCRHFVTGPAFLGGQMSLLNELFKVANRQVEQHTDLEIKRGEIKASIDKEDECEYVALTSNMNFDSSEREFQEVKMRKTQSELESAAKKTDMFLCDIQSLTSLLMQTKDIVNLQSNEFDSDGKNQLLVQPGNKLEFSFEESSSFRQLNEICENAVVFESASAEMAVSPRSQMIDKMMAFNNLKPMLFKLDAKQQLIVGNQISNFLLSRLKSWDKVDRTIECQTYLQEMAGQEELAQDLVKLLEPKLKRIQ